MAISSSKEEENLEEAQNQAAIQDHIPDGSSLNCVGIVLQRISFVS